MTKELAPLALSDVSVWDLAKRGRDQLASMPELQPISAGLSAGLERTASAGGDALARALPVGVAAMVGGAAVAAAGVTYGAGSGSSWHLARTYVGVSSDARVAAAAGDDPNILYGEPGHRHPAVRRADGG